MGRRERAVPVACAIWDNALSASLKGMKTTGLTGVEIIPFGSMESSFDIEQILLEEIKKRAADTQNAYDSIVYTYKSKNSK